MPKCCQGSKRLIVYTVSNRLNRYKFRCIIVGIILGDGLNLIIHDIIESLRPFTMFALGAIGFMVGFEIQRKVHRKTGIEVLHKHKAADKMASASV